MAIRNQTVAEQPKPKPDGNGKRGRPPSGKVRISILIDPDVIEKFKATGDGWQARMNEALRKAAP